MQLEEAFLFSNKTTLLLGHLLNLNIVITTSLFRFTSTEYFIILDNSNL